ncbi:MAG: nucleotide pyrophosphohydrolase [Candidatus Lokiarchaeota archaeon]|nr:nucleotide pyrophosphohydrolase [Candidatus Lokiarchaeota archaeon]
MKISEFQELIRNLYFKKDSKRGINNTFIWLIEEIGELATLLNEKLIDPAKISEELADIIAWTTSIANLMEIDLEKALAFKYPDKCKKCNANPCHCENKLI